MFSIICVYNSREAFEKYLMPGLLGQTAEYELIALDNTGGRFRSAAEALNEAARKARGKYLMFVHQDVALGSPDFLERVERTLDPMPGLGIAGVAGKKENSRLVITNMEHGTPPEHAGHIRVKDVTEVQTLDESLAIVPSAVFRELQFDERTCDGWHLYVLDYCLSARTRGYKVCVLPEKVYHASRGFSTERGFRRFLAHVLLPEPYFRTLEKILAKHKEHYNVVSTNFGNWRTGLPAAAQRIMKIPLNVAVLLVKKTIRTLSIGSKKGNHGYQK